MSNTTDTTATRRQSTGYDMFAIWEIPIVRDADHLVITISVIASRVFDWVAGGIKSLVGRVKMPNTQTRIQTTAKKSIRRTNVPNGNSSNPQTPINPAVGSNTPPQNSSNVRTPINSGSAAPKTPTTTSESENADAGQIDHNDLYQIAAEVRDELFAGINPHYQQFIFDAFGGNKLGLIRNMRSFFLAYDQNPLLSLPDGFKTNPDSHTGITISKIFLQKISDIKIQKKLDLLKEVKEETIHSLELFTNDEWNLIHAIIKPPN